MNLGLLVQKFPQLRLDEQRQYALNYYLESVLPKGGVVEVVAPGAVLQEVLPGAAAAQQCKVLPVHASAEFRHALAECGVLAREGMSDVTLIEPDFFVSGGALVRPENNARKNVVGAGSVTRWTRANPKTHDFVPLAKVVTELGVMSVEECEFKLSGLF